jgi:hypothetical protein
MAVPDQLASGRVPMVAQPAPTSLPFPKPDLGSPDPSYDHAQWRSGRDDPVQPEAALRKQVGKFLARSLKRPVCHQHIEVGKLCLGDLVGRAMTRSITTSVAAGDMAREHARKISIALSSSQSCRMTFMT